MLTIVVAAYSHGARWVAAADIWWSTSRARAQRRGPWVWSTVGMGGAIGGPRLQSSLLSRVVAAVGGSWPDRPANSALHASA